jgi:bacterioferritin
MRGDAQVIDLLNEVLTAELTAINQYFVHYKMLENWGYKGLAKQKKDESIGEMKHADQVIERILFLGGIPNMQRMNPVSVGEDPVEMHRLDLKTEVDAVERLNRGIELARNKGDNGTRLLLDDMLKHEEEAVDWLEGQLYLIEKLGAERYLAEHIHDCS